MSRLIAIALLASCSLETNPAQVSFGGRSYDVSYAAGVCLVADHVKCLGDDGTLLVHDFTGDDVDDFALYMDVRDGFRHTFAYLDIYRNDGTPLDAATPDEAKYKDGRWIWIDPARYPGLRAARFTRFMDEQNDRRGY